jgi:hypothetical protein
MRTRKARIDISQKAGGRCFGPRFTKFLHGAQQFAALGDVVVGSSQNVITCGVWSVLRTCLLVGTSFMYRFYRLDQLVFHHQGMRGDVLELPCLTIFSLTVQWL